MIEGNFDSRTLANMNAALDRVCEQIPRGEEHAMRKRIARQIVKCAKSGKTTLDELSAAAETALSGMAATSKPAGENSCETRAKARLQA